MNITMRRALTISITILLTVLHVGAAGATGYEIIDLGTLGGNESHAYGVNSKGQVVGSSITADNLNHAFLYENGAMVDLGTLGGSMSRAKAINEAGQIVGESHISNGERRAFLYWNGTMSNLGTLGGSVSVAYDINDNGVIAGTSYNTSTYNRRGFVYSNGVMTPIEYPNVGWMLTYGEAINNSGQVTGCGYNSQFPYARGYVWLNGVFQIKSMGTFGGSYSTGMGINDQGVVCGYADNSSGYSHAFRYEMGGSGSLEDLGTLGGNNSWAMKINGSGSIVGYSETADGEKRAFVWNETQGMIDLNSLLPEGSGWVLEEAMGINDLDEIVGSGRINNETHAFLLRKASVTNTPPIADAGSDQVTNEGASVTLNGSGSTDPDGNPLTYSWIQTAGIAVDLDVADPVHPTFTAPTVGTGGETLTFQLIVNDGEADSEPAIVNVTVKNVNHAPVARSGNAQTVQEGSPVALDGSGSYDPDGDSLTYSWTQVSGPAVSLSGADTQIPGFIAPYITTADAALVFSLTVSDGTDTSAADQVTVTVENVNHPPVADAGVNRTVTEWSPVTLDGSGSTDPDNNPLTYSWEQTGGTPVALSDSTSVSPTFTAPQVGSGGETLQFELTVTDSWGSADTASVDILVQNINDPPICANAYADPSSMWPPNHKMVAVRIFGVTDRDNDKTTISVTGVTQDEPINGLGDGDTSPDAVIQSDGSVLLRAERAGKGNGRVYSIQFTATDQYGQSCSGSVAVTVPHNKKGAAVDSGQNHDSLQ